jgi:uncharacterized caspase-like protein
MLLRFAVLVGLVGSMVLGASAARAERRVALVIGNSAYVHAMALSNPINDAGDVAEALKKLGFEVHLGRDLDQQAFAAKMEEFARDLEGADVGLFFYAGHALQINERNYLVTTGAKLESEFLISSETMDLEPIIRLMESKTATNLIFLDACRNNPLAENLRRNLVAQNRSANLGRGLARVESAGRDTLVAFAAAPGQEAKDGSGRNSPFTSALLRHVITPDLEVSVMLKQVAADVRKETHNAQRPQQLSDMSRVFYFAGATGTPGTKIAAVKPESAPVQAEANPGLDRSLDVAFWTSVQSSNDCESVRAYLQRFPDGVFTDLAKLAERRLCGPGRRVSVEPGQGAAAKAEDAVASPALTPASKNLTPAAVGPPPALAAPPLPAAPPVIASPEVAMLPAPTSPAPEARQELARDIQDELIRLGCATREADGTWGAATRIAVEKFNRYVRAKFDVEAPSTGLMTALRERSARVCPLECGAGFRLRGDECVAVTPAKVHEKDNNKDAERRREIERKDAARAKERRREAAREQDVRHPTAVEKPTPRKNTVDGSARSEAKPKFPIPQCQTAYQLGNKWCCTYDLPGSAPRIICP